MEKPNSIEVRPEDMELMAQLATRLVQHNPQFGSLVASMLAARQLYAMTLYEMELLCSESDFRKASKVEGMDNLDVPKELDDKQLIMLKEILINSAAVTAQNPFDENQLFEGMVNTVFPWMRDVVAKHNEAQAKIRKESFEAAEQERAASPVVLNIPALQDTAPSSFDRSTSLLLIGEEAAVKWVTNRCKESRTEEGSNVKQVLHLTENSSEVSENYVSLPREIWQDCAMSNESFQRLYETHVMDKLNNPVDLLIVDDVTATKLGIDSLPMASQVNEAQRRLKNWAKKSNCFLVGCVPLNRQLKDKELFSSEYETLRFHNIVKGVVSNKSTVDGVDSYDIYIGINKAGCVPCEEVDSLKISRIITE